MLIRKIINLLRFYTKRIRRIILTGVCVVARKFRLFSTRPNFVIGSFNKKVEGNAFEFPLRAARDPRVRCFVVVKEPSEVLRLRSVGIRAIRRGSFFENLLLEMADAVLTVGYVRSDFSISPSPQAVKVMLWHGTPMKAVGQQNKPFPDQIDFYDLVTATSPFTADIMRNSFGSEGTSLVVTGHPKSDVLLTPLSKGYVLRDILPSENTTLITYLPTWRHDFATEQGGDFGKNAGPLLRVMKDLTAYVPFLKMLEERNAMFVVKPHLWDDLSRLRELHNASGGRIHFLDPLSVDTTDLLRCTDIVVTDYSGVLTDWMILSKPTICFTYDYKEYWSNRGSPCFDFREVFGVLMVDDVQQLVKRLDAFLENPAYLGKEIDKLSQLLHEYRDDRATERIIDVVLDFLQSRDASK